MLCETLQRRPGPYAMAINDFVIPSDGGRRCKCTKSSLKAAVVIRGHLCAYHGGGERDGEAAGRVVMHVCEGVALTARLGNMREHMLSWSPRPAIEDEERGNFKANVFPGVMQPRSLQLFLTEKKKCKKSRANIVGDSQSAECFQICKQTRPSKKKKT